MSQPLLGEYVDGAAPDRNDDVISDLRAENAQLRRDLRQAQIDAATARSENGRAIVKLRTVLSPLYGALQDIFGEMESIGDTGSSSDSTSIDPRQRAIWDSWKKKIGGKSADAIEALLLHGEMTPQGVAVAIGIHPNNVAKVMYKLNQAGILRKNGRNYALKTS